MTSFYYYDQNPLRFSFHIFWWSQWGLNNKSPNVHKKAKPCRILVVVAQWRHHVNGLLHYVTEVPWRNSTQHRPSLRSNLTIHHLRNEKETGDEMHHVIVSGIGTDAPGY